MSQFLSGSYASLRLTGLGARVIKVEHPDGGDLSRRLYLGDTEIGGDSTIFHAVTRNKECLAIDLCDSKCQGATGFGGGRSGFHYRRCTRITLRGSAGFGA